MVAPGSRWRWSRPNPYQLTLAAEIGGICVPDVPVGCEVRALAGCVLLDAVGSVLLLHRRAPCEQWELPGGKVERGESSEEAARREVQEELGVVIDRTGILGDTRFRDRDVAWRYTWYLALDVDGTPEICEADRFDGLAFFSLTDLAHRMAEVSPNVKRFVSSYYEGRILLPLRPSEHRQSA
jgi:8-oxo-dGTP diphosphatase